MVQFQPSPSIPTLLAVLKTFGVPGQNFFFVNLFSRAMAPGILIQTFVMFLFKELGYRYSEYSKHIHQCVLER